MRTLLILAMFTASLANAGWREYEEKRELSLDAGGIRELAIDAGSGGLRVVGAVDAQQIEVTATIQVPDNDEEKAKKVIAEQLVLTLEKNGSNAVLTGEMGDSRWGRGDSGRVHLDVRMPAQMSLDVEDSSGSIVIDDVSGDIVIDDSAGSIKMSQVGGSIDITDSSGSINVSGVGEDISIDDSSGSIVVRNVTGGVIVDDGSGSVTIKDVGKDLIIKEAGSGSLNYANVQGSVEIDD